VKTTATILATLSLPFFSATNVTFDGMRTGELPAGWTCPKGVRSETAQWLIEADPNAPSKPNVLAQISRTGPHYRFPLCLYDKVTSVDGEASVKIKIVSGRENLSAGLVFRATDENNYYLVRASAHDGNIAMFRVEDGKFHSVPVKGARPGNTGVLHPIRAGDWNLLRVQYRGNLTTVYFNHRKLFEAVDSGLSAPGRSGVWTKGDTVASFDDFHIDKKK
jgi:hypothetical protein